MQAAANLENALWQFALDRYRRRGVEGACLDLQDAFGADVCVVFYCLWCGQIGEAVDDADLSGIAMGDIGTWHREVVRPLRKARRAMKNAPSTLDRGAIEAERDRVKAAELGAERLEMAMLAVLARPPSRAAADRESRTALAAANLATYMASLGAQDAVSQTLSLARACVD